MAKQEQLDVLQKGMQAWITWRQQHQETSIDLRNADLSGAHLNRARLREADLRDADLSRAHLGGADLGDARLFGAHLRGADLRNAHLFGAHLNRVDLSGADLSGADLSNSTIGLTIWGNVNLSTVIGLETVQHEFPSTIGIDTIYQSQGQIPDIFLQKAGVQDSFMEVMAAITNRPIEYYTCFISYSSQDQAFVQRVYADLQSRGVRCWFAPEDLKIGDKIRARIDESIRIYDKLLLILSKHAIASNWVEYEVEAALAKERREQRTVLFPLRVDSTVMESTTAWAAHIHDTRNIGNFEHWKDHDAYLKAFDRLIRDLKADAAKDAT